MLSCSLILFHLKKNLIMRRVSISFASRDLCYFFPSQIRARTTWNLATCSPVVRGEMPSVPEIRSSENPGLRITFHALFAVVQSEEARIFGKKKEAILIYGAYNGKDLFQGQSMLRSMNCYRKWPLTLTQVSR